MRFQNLLGILENPPLEKLINDNFSEETDFTGKVGQGKIQFENHNKVPHDNYHGA